MDKVKDGVTSRIHPRDEGRPGNRAKRRHGGLERFEISLRGELFKIGQMTRRHKFFQQLGVKTINRQYENLLGRYRGALGQNQNQRVEEQDPQGGPPE